MLSGVAGPGIDMAAEYSRQLLVPNKLSPQQQHETCVSRPRLLTQLGAAPDTRLILIVAPPGFGKSTLVAQWIARAQPSARDAVAGQAEHGHSAPQHYAWLTLDEHDQGSLRFLTYVAGAIEHVAPGALPATRDLLAAATPPLPFAVLEALLVDLSALPAPLTLVLDDYHTVGDEEIHRTVAYLLRHMPPSCRLVLLSRAEPPLPLAGLRAGRQMIEVRAADLCFTEAETEALLTNVLGATPDAALVTALQQYTEGWAIALRLAAPSRAAMSAWEPAAATRQIFEYLAGEVLARQPASVQQILPILAVPERFCAGLAAALLGSSDDLVVAEDQIEHLVRENLLLVPLDGQRRWYRFHRLFRDMLLRLLHLTAGQERARDLHLRAAAWLTAEGLVQEAVGQLLAGGDADAAAALVERQLLPELRAGTGSVASDRWLHLLPAELIARRPALLLLAAHAAMLSLNLDGLHTSLAHAERLMAAPEGIQPAAPWATFRADLAALRGIMHCWQGAPAEAARQLRSALEQGPSQALAAQALQFLGLSHAWQGPAADGAPLPEDDPALELGDLRDDRAVYRYAWMCGRNQIAGDLDAQMRDAQQLARAVAARGLGDTWEGHVALARGLVAYERSNLNSAAAHFELLARRKYRVSPPGYMSSLVGLALISAASGAYAEAAANAEAARSFAAEAGGAFLHHQALGCAVRVALARGDIGAALQAAEGIGRDIHLGASLWLEIPRLSQARALIAAGNPASLAQAGAIIAGCLAELESLRNMRPLVGALAIQALLQQAQGLYAEACATLERAVALAAPLGFVRTFVDLGPPLQPLLRELAQRSETSHPRRILAAFDALAFDSAPPLPPAPDLPGLLTRREAEILALLAQRWSDNEIAERLIIAPNTVRRHTSAIYHKLGVRGRREAVIAARALGLLPGAARS